MDLAGELNLNYDNVAFLVLGFYVYSVELVVSGFLIALALKNLGNTQVFANEHFHQALENIEVGFVAQHTFYSPVKTDYPIIIVHCA